MTASDQEDHQLTPGAFGRPVDAIDRDNLAVVDHHLSLTSCRLDTLIDQLPQGIGSHHLSPEAAPGSINDPCLFPLFKEKY